MNDSIREVARVGLVHHLLYGEAMGDADAHARTLAEFVRRGDIDTFDCCLPFGDERRRRLVPIVRDCGKEDIAYANFMFPGRKISFGSTSAAEQGAARILMEDQIALAEAIGATGFVFASGADVPHDRPAAKEAFADFCRWFCRRLKPAGIVALLEPFDRDIDKKYLYGPTAQCVELIESLAGETDNLKIELDMAHLPLMGETFADALRAAGPHLGRIHLGNCVLRDPGHPRYGDTHPPLGFDAGEHDVGELAEFLRLLVEVGYLGRGGRRSLVLEITPFPDRTADDTVADNLARLDRAWAAA